MQRSEKSVEKMQVFWSWSFLRMSASGADGEQRSKPANIRAGASTSRLNGNTPAVNGNTPAVNGNDPGRAARR